MKKEMVLTDTDRQKWYKLLLTYYQKKGLQEEEAKEKIEKVFKEVQEGWDRAPYSLAVRIKMKTGYQWKSYSNLHPRKKNEAITEEIPENPDDEDFTDTYFFNSMTKGEKKWWVERNNIYSRDFDFNNSADKPLIQQLLVEELIQRRLFKKQIMYPNNDYSKRMTENLKRITELQTKLGITREQRAGIINKIDGNVAEIALTLDEKMAKMPDELKKMYEQEAKLQFLKDQNPPNNILPPLEKMKAMLQINGKGTNVIEEAQTEIIAEEIAKTINENHIKTQENKLSNLPDGIDLST